MRSDLEIYQSLTPGWLHRQLHGLGGESPRPHSEEVDCVLMFVDISGFTALSERLAAVGADGSEQLMVYLNHYFDRIIGVVRDAGADVLKLAGDGLLVAWPMDGGGSGPVRRAAGCALRIQRECHNYEVAPGEALRLRVGLAAGRLTTIIAGGHLGGWEFVMDGPPVVAVGRAQAAALPGSVVVTDGVLGYLGASASVVAVSDGLWELGGYEVPWEQGGEASDLPEVASEALRGFVPAYLHDNLDTIRAGWLAEIRRVTVLFVQLAADDFGVALAAGDIKGVQPLLHDLQETMHRFEGSINKWTSDEKGHGMLVAFGMPPISHEDDPLRAVMAAFEILRLLKRYDLPGRIGIATGPCYCGLVGNARRQEYTLIGLAVNRAARIVQRAGYEILCDRPTYRHCAGHLAFEALPPSEMKGLHGPQELFRPLAPERRGGGDRQSTAAAMDAPALLAHGQAWAGLQLCLEGFSAGGGVEGGLVIVEGEAGIGKSTLLRVVREAVEAKGLALISAQAESLHRSTPYRLWQQILRQLLDRAEVAEGASDAVRVAVLLQGGSHGMLLAPLLNDLLPLALEDNYLTAQMTGRLRADNLRQLIGTLVEQAARQRPMVMVLDDQHWCDASSIQLTLAVLRQVSRLLLVVSTRPPEADAAVRELYQVENRRLIRLEAFSHDELGQLLRRHFECAAVDAEVTRFIHVKSHGNPLFAMEIASSLLERGSLSVGEGGCRAVFPLRLETSQLPDSLQGVITERIDRLEPLTQMTAKVASIIGPRFDCEVLEDIFPLVAERRRLANHLQALQDGEVVRPTDLRQRQFDFSHALIHEAVYQLLLQSQRRQIHRAVAEWFEARMGEANKHQSVVLAWHWKHAEEPLRAARLLGTAAGLAVREGAYREGLDHIGQALEMTLVDGAGLEGAAMATPVERGGWLRLKAEALMGLGNLAAAAAEFCSAVASLGHPVPDELDAAAIQRRWRVEIGRPTPSDPGPEGVEEAGGGAMEVEQRRHLVFCYEVLTILQLFSCQRVACVGMADLALRLARPLGPGPELARALASVAIAAAILPDRRLARRFADAAIGLAGSLDQIRTLSRVHEFVGMMRLGFGHWRRAEEAFVSAIEGFRLVGDERCRIECNCLYSTYQHYRGNFGRRVLMGMEVSEMARHSGDQQGVGWGSLDQLESLIVLGEFGAAEALAGSIEGRIGISIVACDVIMARGLIARLAVRIGDLRRAVSQSLMALELMRASDPTIVYNLEAQAAPAEVMLACWEREAADAVPPPWAGWSEAAVAALGQLARFARVFPVARPRFWLWRGEWHRLNGDLPSARRCLKRALRQAEKLRMPYEEALARWRLWAVLPEGDSGRAGHLGIARELFTTMRADHDLRALPPDDPESGN